MNKIKILVAFVSLALTGSQAWSGSTTSTLQFVQVNVDPNRAYIKFDSPPTNGPSCATDDRMTIDLQTTGGRAAMSSALAAKASNRQVFVAGTGTCIGGFERVSYMRVL
jgi:hypothetical protein